VQEFDLRRMVAQIEGCMEMLALRLRSGQAADG
jgi:hypothetical protein